MYDPKSKVATEFISHEEIEATLAFGETFSLPTPVPWPLPKSTNMTANTFKLLSKRQKLLKASLTEKRRFYLPVKNRI